LLQDRPDFCIKKYLLCDQLVDPVVNPLLP
jgi:hypothetical protein